VLCLLFWAQSPLRSPPRPAAPPELLSFRVVFFERCVAQGPGSVFASPGPENALPFFFCSKKSCCRSTFPKTPSIPHSIVRVSPSRPFQGLLSHLIYSLLSNLFSRLLTLALILFLHSLLHLPSLAFFLTAGIDPFHPFFVRARGSRAPGIDGFFFTMSF